MRRIEGISSKWNEALKGIRRGNEDQSSRGLRNIPFSVWVTVKLEMFCGGIGNFEEIHA